MGCGSSVSQVADIGREGGFRPIHLLQTSELETIMGQGKVYLFGETRTQRKILECDLKSNNIKNISTRARIPFPKIHLDPIESMYEESQEVFHLGIYGFTMQPPFNNMLTLFLQKNLLFMCGGRDYDCYNVKNEAFFYSIVEEPFKISSEMIHSSQLSERTLYKPKYSNNRFQKMASMNKNRYSHTGMYCSNSKSKSILVLGGISQKNEFLASCELYNIFENTWKQILPMKNPRANAHCFQYGSKVYVFGGRSSKEKLSKKIQTLSLDTFQWSMLNFKLHRGIEEALLFSQNPNEILIVGGRTSFQPCRSVIKVDMNKQTYVWDSNLAYEYSQAKGVVLNHEVVIFGGEKDLCQTYYNKKWKRNTFDHRKLIQLEDLQKFSFSRESLVVKAVEAQSKMAENNEEEELFFGNDVYPCLLFYNKSTGKTRKEAVPLTIRLKSNMGILQYEKNMYILIGGSDQTQNKSSRSCFFYDRKENLGTLGLKMSQKRFNFACVSHGNWIYVFGGFSNVENKVLSSCQRYNFVLWKWQDIKDMKSPRSKATAEVIGRDKIAVIGGDRSHCLRDIQIYNIQTDEFQVFRIKFDILGDILLSYSHSEQGSIYLVRRDESNQYFQCSIDVNPSEPELMAFEEKKIAHEDHIINFQNQQNIKVEPLIEKDKQQIREQSEQSSDLHKLALPVSSLNPFMIEIKKQKRLIDQKSDGIVEEEEYEEDIEIEKVVLQNNVVEEIKKNGKFLIEEMIKESVNQNSLEEEEIKPSEESQINSPMSPDISRKISEKMEKLKAISLDNQNKVQHKSNLNEVSRPQDSGKLLEWLQSINYHVIKRGKNCFFTNGHTIMRLDLQTDEIVEQEAENMEVKAQYLS